MKVEISTSAITRTKTSAARPWWMVVDDDDSVRNFIVAVLEMRGVADVSSFRCGSEALAAFAAKPDQFTFVITDLDMPGMNGVELCQRLRALAPQLKIALATGNGSITEIEARQSGFNGLLSKPFTAAEIWCLTEAIGVHPNPANTPH